MKQIAKIIFLSFTFFCFTAGISFAGNAIPNLKGHWIAKSYGHHNEARGFFNKKEPQGSWVIKDQNGRFFVGERTYVNKRLNNKKITEGFSGVISRDGKRLYIADHDGDYLFGDVLSDKSIELIIMNDGNGNKNPSSIGLVEITRK